LQEWQAAYFMSDFTPGDDDGSDFWQQFFNGQVQQVPVHVGQVKITDQQIGCFSVAYL